MYFAESIALITNLALVFLAQKKFMHVVGKRGPHATSP